MGTLSANSSFSDIFDQDSPEFIDALCTTVFPGEVPPCKTISTNGRRAQLSEDNEVVTRLSQDFMKHLSRTSKLCEEDDEDDAEQRPAKRIKTSHEEFVQGSSTSVMDQHYFQTSPQDDIDQCFVEELIETRSSQGPKPLHTTDPVSLKAAARVPGYAANKSNEHAERLMQDASFRAAHTSAAGAEFIDGFYKNSRLHHLSTWKVELRALVAEAQERVDTAFARGDEQQSAAECVDGEKSKADGLVGKVNAEGSSSTSMRGNAFQLLQPPSGKGKGKAKEQDAVGSEEAVIMHCDFDCFFASVGLLTRPYLKDKPVVVCHSQGTQGGESSTSEVSSANYKARESGIRSGMSLRQARTLCPSVVTIPYEFEKYKKASLQLYTILMSHADDLEAVSVDEALIDVSTAVKQMLPSTEPRYDPSKAFAEMLRAEIKNDTGCDVSIGISHNIMLARLATRKAKPAGSYHLRLADLQRHIEHTCIDELHGFGHAARDKALERLGCATLGELAKKPRSVLCDVFGKTMGSTLYDYCRGIDQRRLQSDKPRKSVSAEINYGIRFESGEQAQAFMFQLAEEVGRRLDAIEMRGRSLTLKIMKRDLDAPVEAPKFLGHGCCNVFNKQANLSSADGRATSDALIIGQTAWGLLKDFAFDPRDLRGVGIQMQKLEKASESETRPGELAQGKLPFKKVRDKDEEVQKDAKGADIIPNVQAPSSQSQDDDEVQEVKPPSPPVDGMASNLALPSFSQVDQASFEALPPTLKIEIKAEYSRRSASPALSVIGDDRTPSLSPPKRRTTEKGTPLSRITQALAPRSRDGSSRSGASTNIQKQNIFERCVKQKERGTRVVVSRAELSKLGIDARVFYELPPEVQLEQLSSARFARSFRSMETEKKEK